MTTRQSQCWILTGYPEGVPDATTFRLESRPLPEPAAGDVSLETLCLSVDPYMRGRMSPAKSYVAPLQPGDVVSGETVARVVESRHPDFAAGDLALAPLGWRTAGVLAGSALQKLALPVERASLALGALGMPGLTAYFGLLEVGRPRPGDTVLVSGAAGAVGSLAGQIARLMGCRAVGVAGSDAKVRWLTGELGFDAAVNYKAAEDLRAALAPLCPDGVDVYFDNVGGAVSDAALGLINVGARIAICGQIAQYNAKNPPRGPRPFATLLVRRARAEGFIIFDFRARFPEAQRRLARWVEDGRLRVRETVVEGFANVPRAFVGLFSGENTGKMVVRL
jgi:NADPH:quinone reductase